MISAISDWWNGGPKEPANDIDEVTIEVDDEGNAQLVPVRKKLSSPPPSPPSFTPIPPPPIPKKKSDMDRRALNEQQRREKAEWQRMVDVHRMREEHEAQERREQEELLAAQAEYEATLEEQRQIRELNRRMQEDMDKQRALMERQRETLQLNDPVLLDAEINGEPEFALRARMLRTTGAEETAEERAALFQSIPHSVGEAQLNSHLRDIDKQAAAAEAAMEREHEAELQRQQQEVEEMGRAYQREQDQRQARKEYAAMERLEDEETQAAGDAYMDDPTFQRANDLEAIGEADRDVEHVLRVAEAIKEMHDNVDNDGSGALVGVTNLIDPTLEHPTSLVYQPAPSDQLELVVPKRIRVDHDAPSFSNAQTEQLDRYEGRNAARGDAAAKEHEETTKALRQQGDARREMLNDLKLEEDNKADVKPLDLSIPVLHGNARMGEAEAEREFEAIVEEADRLVDSRAATMNKREMEIIENDRILEMAEQVRGLQDVRTSLQREVDIRQRQLEMQIEDAASQDRARQEQLINERNAFGHELSTVHRELEKVNKIRSATEDFMREELGRKEQERLDTLDRMAHIQQEMELLSSDLAAARDREVTSAGQVEAKRRELAEMETRMINMEFDLSATQKVLHQLDAENNQIRKERDKAGELYGAAKKHLIDIGQQRDALTKERDAARRDVEEVKAVAQKALTKMQADHAKSHQQAQDRIKRLEDGVRLAANKLKEGGGSAKMRAALEKAQTDLAAQKAKEKSMEAERRQIIQAERQKAHDDLTQARTRTRELEGMLKKATADAAGMEKRLVSERGEFAKHLSRTADDLNKNFVAEKAKLEKAAAASQASFAKESARMLVEQKKLEAALKKATDTGGASSAEVTRLKAELALSKKALVAQQKERNDFLKAKAQQEKALEKIKQQALVPKKTSPGPGPGPVGPPSGGGGGPKKVPAIPPKKAPPTYHFLLLLLISCVVDEF